MLSFLRFLFLTPNQRTYQVLYLPFVPVQPQQVVWGMWDRTSILLLNAFSNCANRVLGLPANKNQQNKTITNKNKNKTKSISDAPLTSLTFFIPHQVRSEAQPSETRSLLPMVSWVGVVPLFVEDLNSYFWVYRVLSQFHMLNFL